MFSVVDPVTLGVMRPVLVALYAQWAVLWLLVAWHYGRAAYGSWRAEGGVWRAALSDIVNPFAWALRDTLCRLRVLPGKPDCGAEVPSVYFKGQLLRFAIFLGSLTPVIFGFYFIRLDRSGWSALDIWVNLGAVALSTFAAACHLFLAYKSQPGAWRVLVLSSLLWLIAGAPMLGWLGLY